MLLSGGRNKEQKKNKKKDKTKKTKKWEWRQGRRPFQMLLSGVKTTTNNKSFENMIFCTNNKDGDFNSLIHQILQACIWRPICIVISALKFNFMLKEKKILWKIQLPPIQVIWQTNRKTKYWIYIYWWNACALLFPRHFATFWSVWHLTVRKWSAKWMHWNFRQNCEELDFWKLIALVIPGLRVLKPL